MGRIYRGMVVVVAGFAIALTGEVARGDEPGRLPSYTLKLGQELRYRQSSEFRYNTGRDQGVMADGSEIRFRVIRRNPDGSFRVLFDAKERSKTLREPEKSARGVLKDFASKVVTKVQPESVPKEEIAFKLAAFDLFPDGRVVISDSIKLIQNDPTPYLALLPRNPEEARSGWTRPPSGPSGDAVHYRLTRQTPGEWVIDAEFDRFMNKAYQASLRHRIFFDLDHGRVRRIETEDVMEDNWHGRGSGTVELVGESSIPPEPLARLGSEMDTYLNAEERSFELLLKSGDDPSLAEKRLDEADALVKQAQERLTLAEFTDPLAKTIQDRKRLRNYYLDEAKVKAEMIGQNAADWELADLSGKSYKLEAFRGRVVVLDFWYRRCPWCIRAMPQMKELADDFRGQPVAILGMNKDPESKDAQFIADVMGLNYPTLRAEGIAERYNVHGFPTLIIIDPQGKIADFHVGYSLRLRRELGEKIRHLLINFPKAAMNPKAN